MTVSIHPFPSEKATTRRDAFTVWFGWSFDEEEELVVFKSEIEKWQIK